MAAGDLLFLESFDRYPGIIGIGGARTVWSDPGNALEAIVDGRYFGGKAVQSYSSSNNGDRAHRHQDLRYNQAAMGAAIKPDTSSWRPLLGMVGPDGDLTLGVDDTGRLVLVRGFYGNFGYDATNLLGVGNKAYAITAAVWQYLEWSVNGTGAGAAVQAWVNGELCLDLPNVAINRPQGFHGFGIATRNARTIYDDLYIREGAARLGEIKIESIIADGTASNNLPTLVGAATAHQAVNEMPVDGDTSYIAGITAGQGARFTFGDLTTIPDVIRAVQIRSFARKDETAYRSLKNAVKVNAAEAIGKEHVLGTSYKYFHDIVPLNPETNAAWTKAAVDGMTAGLDIFA